MVHLDVDPWRWAIGHGVARGRLMKNHHGYVDGYQLEFGFGTSQAAVGRCIELVTVASRLIVGTALFE